MFVITVLLLLLRYDHQKSFARHCQRTHLFDTFLITITHKALLGPYLHNRAIQADQYPALSDTL